VRSLFAGRIVQTLRDRTMERPAGVCSVVVDGWGTKVYVACAGGLCAFGKRVGTAEFKILAALPFPDADNVRFDPTTLRVWVGFGGGRIGAIHTVTDVADPADLGAVLAAHPEAFALGPCGSRLYVNLAAKGAVVVVDASSGAVHASHALPSGCAQNYALAMDDGEDEKPRLLLGVRQPPCVLTLDCATGAELGRLPCAPDVDDLLLDAATKTLYAISGAGSVEAFSVGADAECLGAVATAVGARTGVWCPQRRRLYVAAPRTGACPVARVLVFQPTA